jgi:hypothetical protein
MKGKFWQSKEKLKGYEKQNMEKKEEEKKKADVCREFGLVNSTIQTTW